MTIHIQNTENHADIDALQRQAESQMNKIVPISCRAMSYSLLPLKCPYWDNLHAACNRVVGWSQSLFDDSNRSFYLYGSMRSIGSDGNDVKPHLLELGRYCATLYSSLIKVGRDITTDGRFPVVSVETLIREFDSRRFKNGGREPQFNISSKIGSKQVTFDGYLDHLANQPVLFIENIGQGETRGRVRDVLERLVNPRGRRRLPTFFSSDHSIPELKGYFGDWLIRQMIAGRCDQVDVRAAA